ncbi:uncharacterized protein LOC108863722 [Galendromus occidentalis]|uniref:Uncharacterized protein LOC108863722 n=1 Tax=Galendromus occidentalis TaxID=34638 RepID=A0AAJ7P8Z3_9ACAR|nr:uncharacterized protein LOC108863722 [Galendromus occidentalis]
MQLGTSVRKPPLSATVGVYNLDPTITEKEVENVIRRTLNRHDEDDIKVESIRCSEAGDRSTLLRLRKKDAETLSKIRKVRIGWQTCTLREWKSVPEGYRCQEVGHLAAGCRRDAKPRRCYKCGTEGHIGRECQAMEQHCHKCKASAHTAYSSACPVFRETLESMKKAHRAPTNLDQAGNFKTEPTGPVPQLAESPATKDIYSGAWVTVQTKKNKPSRQNNDA